jgi:MarR family transcriptional regulator, organic hydroperoxide resistance regulator
MRTMKTGQTADRAARAEAESAELPDVLQFMRLLWAITHGLQTASKRMTRDLGVTGPQRLVLRVIGLFPGSSPGSLARVLHVHPSTLTGVLHRLTSQGLLERTADPDDRRRSILRLTARGTRVNAMGRGTVEAAVRRALQQVSDADRAATRRVFTVLAEQLLGESALPGARRPHRRTPQSV